VRLAVFLLDLLGCSLSVLAENWYGSVCALHNNVYFIYPVVWVKKNK